MKIVYGNKNGLLKESMREEENVNKKNKIKSTETLSLVSLFHKFKKSWNIFINQTGTNSGQHFRTDKEIKSTFLLIRGKLLSLRLLLTPVILSTQ